MEATPLHWLPDCIYDSKLKLFLKQGISRQLGRGWTQLFDLNARIQQLTWSLIVYEKYSTSLSYLWFWTPLILGGSVISAGTIHDLRRVKVPGTGPLWNPCNLIMFSSFIQHFINVVIFVLVSLYELGHAHNSCEERQTNKNLTAPSVSFSLPFWTCFQIKH